MASIPPKSTAPKSSPPLAGLVLSRPDGSPKPLADYAGRPLVIQTLRYFG